MFDIARKGPQVRLPIRESMAIHTSTETWTVGTMRGHQMHEQKPSGPRLCRCKSAAKQVLFSEVRNRDLKLYVLQAVALKPFRDFRAKKILTSCRTCIF